jgi:catechol 2,3-dioxygenase-like lactoylglutathione lyase family enzyme
MSDLGLTHIALPVANVGCSIAFYIKYAGMSVVHRRIDRTNAKSTEVVWITDKTRPFVIVLIEMQKVEPILSPIAHLGIGCASREEIDRLCNEARGEGILREGPCDSGYPIGYWAFISDPDGHTLELSYGQEVALTVVNAS